MNICENKNVFKLRINRIGFGIDFAEAAIMFQTISLNKFLKKKQIFTKVLIEKTLGWLYNQSRFARSQFKEI